MSLVPPPGGPGDALHRDETIPVLTDVIRLPRDPEPEPVAQAFSDDDWAALAARVETSVTERMLLHAGPMLDASLDSMLTNLLQRAGAQLAQDLHDVFSHLVRDLVARAVTEELTLLHARSLQPDSPPAPRSPLP
ncbi:MAG: hypothetical protein KA778_01455 [Burkholderiaceae bacterium]|nr:hypothetical protein [Burkholderiaceae bacterium]MBP7658642.1 hypothetical protein [Burkholderiaceae bacterium]